MVLAMKADVMLSPVLQGITFFIKAQLDHVLNIVIAVICVNPSSGFTAVDHRVYEQLRWNRFFGTRDRTRTGTAFRPIDFKSLVSTIAPRGQACWAYIGPRKLTTATRP